MTTKQELENQVIELTNKLNEVKEQAKSDIEGLLNRFDKVCSATFLQDLMTTQKTTGCKEKYLLTEYFNRQFLLNEYMNGKRIYKFNCYIEKLCFDTLYFKYQNTNGTNAFQATFLDEKGWTVRHTLLSENLTEGQLNFYNRIYAQNGVNIPLNSKCEKQYELEEMLNIDYSMI